MLPEEEQRTQARVLYGELPDEEKRRFSKAMAEPQQRVKPHPQRAGSERDFDFGPSRWFFLKSVFPLVAASTRSFETSA